MPTSLRETGSSIHSHAGPVEHSITPSNLPALRSPLIGRQAELDHLRQLLLRDDVPLVTLTGPGGAGKTSLALHAANSLLPSFKDGVFLANLAPLSEASQVIPLVTQVVGTPASPGKGTLASLSAFLGSRTVLIVLDNLEHLADSPLETGALLEACPRLKIIATSREPLRIRGEQVFPVEPLSLDAAVELFTLRARSLDPAFSVSADQINSVGQLCMRLDCLPLAIELAALRSRLLTPKRMLDHLQSQAAAPAPVLDLLGRGPRDLPPRQQTLRLAIAWSYDLLSREERSLLRLASIFPADCSMETLQEVIDLPRAALTERLSSLVDKNLLLTSPAATEEVRFGMLETIREFALEQAARAGEINVLREKIGGAFASLTAQAMQGLRSAARPTWTRRLEAEYPNLLAVIDWGFTAPPGSSAWMAGLKVLADLRQYWMFQGSFHFAERWIERGRAAVEVFSFTATPPTSRFAEINRLRAGIYSLSGSYAWALGDFEASRQWHQRSYTLYADLGDESGMGEALNDLAVCLFELGEYENALQGFQQALDLHVRLDDRWEQMRDLNNLGSGLEGLGRLNEAMEALTRGLSLAHELHEQYYVIPLLCNLAHLHIHQGEHFKAGMLLERCMDQPGTSQFPYLRAWVLALLASAQLGQGQASEAAGTLREVLPLLEQLGDADLKRSALLAAAKLSLHLGKPSASAKILGSLEAHLSRGRRSPIDQAEYETMLKKMRLGSSREKLETALAIGRSMPLKETIDYALRQADELLLPPRGVLHGLTRREHQVLTLLAQGKSNEEIAGELVIVLKTVEKHVGSILQKLGAKNRTEAAGWVLHKSPPNQPL